jgi:phosphoribosylformylglycinamidine synthase I
MTVGIVPFPGSNCEDETAAALAQLGIPYTIIPWHTTDDVSAYSGFVFPGGFSFQDRIRAGVIAAKLPIMARIKALSGSRPILGICNGAQILVEAGFLSDGDTLDCAIDANRHNGEAIGFVCDWGFLSPVNPSKNVFLKSFSESDVLPVQVCHAEGRFIHQGAPVSGLKYTQLSGAPAQGFPYNPNGSQDNWAAISNSAGNVLAIMPHPERSMDSRVYPQSIRVVADRHGYRLVPFTTLFKGFVT